MRGRFQKGFDARRHVFTAEERRRGFETTFRMAFRETIPTPAAGSRSDKEVSVANDRAGSVEDSEVRGPCVQVDTRIESVLFVIEAHHGLLGLGGT
jgi:hypothetical protein